ncbi:hypothetical protein COHA_001755 [Chlorella ohadii]|uniref:DUF1736 domain-containing protein n=1 Tax=Chlorella ohadii TaxID=2649997 RepID=A0AAD5DYN7_9CHLO|nr:hypothetical protein COHA_001755 [Chlorella ohadii]
MPSTTEQPEQQHHQRRRRRLPLTPLLLAAIAVAVYANTLTAQFTFDDSFAIQIYNGDVTDDRKPLRALLTNDFWGQQLSSPMSHKSYRPLTVLSFRLQHRLGRALLGDWKEEASRVPLPPNLAAGGGGGSSGSSRPLMGDHQQRRGHTINPLTFHACNVAAHAGVTVLVYRLARRLAAARSWAGGAGAASSSGSSSSSGGSGSGSSAGDGFDWTAFSFEPFLAALLFALHPVHTEAVAGVVGHAELLCAALSIPALLCYMAAADGRVASARAYWARLAAAVALGWAAALTKEIGITIMGAMVCYDLLVAPLFPQQLQRLFPARHLRRLPHMPSQHPLKHHAQHQQQEKDKQGEQQQPQQQTQGQQQPAQPKSASGGGSGRHNRGASPAAVAAAATQLLQQVAAAANGGGGSEAHQLDAASRRQALRLKLQRILIAALAVLLYVKARSWLAGDQLVRIYRKVENPIPFATSSLTRKLTTGYLHARYAGLLLAPVQLSADWSYACIEYVSSLADPRNLATLLLYSLLAYLALAARPWRVLQEWSGHREEAPGPAERSARWRLAVLAGLLVGPFFPASNVLFYVGTFIGERLLYFPSVGYCLLLAEVLAAALQPLLPQSARSRAYSSGSGSALPSRAQLGGAVVSVLLLGAMLGFYAVRTVERNRDWWDEERLFRAAQKVCWRSGKVQLNSGIIERRYQNWEKAEAHFRLAREADPEGFCEPDFHIGLTLLGSNLTRAVEYLEKGVACKYTAADSVKGLNQIFQHLLDSTPQHAPEVMERWGAVLARPHLQRYTEAATYYESAALKARSPLQAVLITNRGQSMLAEAAQGAVPIGRTPEFPVRVPADLQTLERLARCMAARRPVVLTTVGAGVATEPDGLATQPVKQAAYSYLAQHGEDCRQPIQALEAEGEDAAARSATFHTGLLHALQQADVNDPWLQQEWGLMLVASGRTQEALAHLEVAGHIFAAQLLPPSQAADKSLRQVTVLDASGARPISEAEAAAAAVAAYRHALHAVETLSAEPGKVVDPAAKSQVVCRLLRQVCDVLHAQHAQHAQQATELATCLAELQQAGCTADGGSSGAQPGQPSGRDEL